VYTYTRIYRRRHGIQESRAVAREPRDVVAVVFGLKFRDNIQYKFKSSQASNARLQSSKHTADTGAKQKLTQNAILGHVFWSQWKGDKGLSNTKYKLNVGLIC